jgi:signal transduction histidine kinase
MAALLTRWAMAPLDRVATSLRAISDAGDLTLRIDPGAPRTHPAVARLTLELNRMLARLELAARRVEEVLVAQRRFVADASHELRTPLTTLRGNIHLLREDEPSDADSEHQAILADMAADTERMTRLVNDLLLLAEADAGLHLALETLDLVPLIRHAARSVRWVREDVELRIDLGSEEPTWVLGDADRLTQVLIVLLDNALKFSPSGGVVDVRLSAAPRQGTPGALVEVADEGPGVAPDERAQIFERFYRSDRARQGEGAGLGLAIARWIVDEHHGTLDLESSSEHGATFGLWLPSTSAPHEA